LGTTKANKYRFNLALNTAVKEYVRAAQQLPQGATLREVVALHPPQSRQPAATHSSAGGRVAGHLPEHG
jgi:hypothetical protein